MQTRIIELWSQSNLFHPHLSTGSNALQNKVLRFTANLPLSLNNQDKEEGF